MDSSLVNATVLLTGLGSEFEDLLKLCRDPNTSARKIGSALRPLIHKDYVDHYRTHASYWYLRAIAVELSQPLLAPRAVAECHSNAKRCTDNDAVKSTYARLRIEVLEPRAEDESRLMEPMLHQLYKDRLTYARESFYMSHAR